MIDLFLGNIRGWQLFIIFILPAIILGIIFLVKRNNRK